MILLIDNYDSFTFNVAHAFGKLGKQIEVVRNDIIGVDQIGAMNPEAIIISPGPGRPEDSGVTCATIQNYAGKIPILGVCLGHQAIGQVFGATITRALSPVHGKVSDIFHDNKGLFKGLQNPFSAARYHSLIVRKETVASPLIVTAETSEGEVMGLRSSELKLEGVQFHPESIATEPGMDLFRNFLKCYVAEVC
ncbi:MAG: aminodeoxychorismate/anthranilate synthase component II [Deltaproteobacteria bacterium]|nr:aminodeoxychorismate/anthranilate synthase component II [Deltaproteobacteria bacterium]